MAAPLWAWLSRQWSWPSLLLAALVTQAVGIGLPAAQQALLVGAMVVLAAAVLRVRFPHSVEAG